MKSLNLYIEDRAGIYFDSVVLQDVLCQTHLVLVFDVHKLLLCLLVVRIDLELMDLRKICDPVVTHMRCHPVCQQRIRMQQETSLCDAVCLVVEFLGHHLVEIFEFLMLQDLRVQSCHAVDRITGCDREMRHLNLPVVDDRHLADLFLIARIHLLDPCHKSAVDLLNDLIYTGKQSGEKLDRPLFQRLCHDRMVGVRAGLGCHFPRLIPGKVILIHQDSHKLCDRNSRMRIVELEGYFLIELADIVMLAHILIYRLLNRCGDKEVLLLETKLLARIVIVVRIKHLDNISGKILLLNRLLVIALVKGIKLEAVYRLCIPDTERVDKAVAVTYDRHIIRDRADSLIALLLEVAASVLIHVDIDIAAEPYFLRILRSSQFKRVSVLEPVVRHFHLITVADLLLEHTVAITDTAAVRRVVQRCQGIEEAGCQSSQTAVSKRCIRFLILHHVDIYAKFIQCLCHLLVSLKIDHVIAKRTTHQKFHREVVHHFRILFLKFFLGSQPLVYHRILDRVGHRLKNLLIGRLLQRFAVKCLDVIKHTSLEKLCIKGCSSLPCHLRSSSLLFCRFIPYENFPFLLYMLFSCLTTINLLKIFVSCAPDCHINAKSFTQMSETFRFVKHICF